MVCFDTNSLGGFMFRIRVFAAPLIFATLVGNSANAQTAFSQITKDDFDQIAKEVSANFTHTSVSGATSLGTIFGFQLGLVLGQTKTPGLNALAKRADQNINIDEVIHGGLLGQLTIPAGVTFETLILPAVGSADFKAKSTSLAAKWTLTEFLLELPVDLAVKGFYTKSELDTKQKISNAEQSISLDDKMMGLAVLVSKNFGIVEPYAGIIHNRASVDMGYSGGANIFSTTYTTSQSASVNTTSTGYLLGAEVKLLFFHAGAEFTRLFGANRYTAKLAFSF